MLNCRQKRQQRPQFMLSTYEANVQQISLFKALFFAHQAIISQDHAPACIRMPIIYNSQQISYLILSPQYFSMN